ncbi:hypothetical protein OSTOST_23893, partial [Ostertagia ostertagi]
MALGFTQTAKAAVLIAFCLPRNRIGQYGGRIRKKLRPPKKQRFKHLTFNQCVASIGGDSARFSRRLSHRPNDSELFFTEALTKWNDQDFGVHYNLGERDVESVEAAFFTLSLLVRIMWRTLIKDFVSSFVRFIPLFGSSRPYVRRFAAESFSFVMRKSSKLSTISQHVVEQAYKVQDERLTEGCAELFFYVCRGVAGGFHSAAKENLMEKASNMVPCTYAARLLSLCFVQRKWKNLFSSQEQLLSTIEKVLSASFFRLNAEFINFFSKVLDLFDTILDVVYFDECIVPIIGKLSEQLFAK